MKATEILQEIVDKGGIIGQCGYYYLTDENLARIYIIECSEQTHNKLAKQHWGLELVRKINEFAKEVKN